MSNSGKVKCTCGWSWNKSDSSKKDMYICHECGRDNSNNMQNGGWLDSYEDGGTMQEHQENYNNSEVSLPEGFVGMGNNTKGRNYSPAWGGQFQMGGSVYPVNYVPEAQMGASIPGAVGFSYARTQSPAPSNGPYAKKTKASAKNGGWLDSYKEGGVIKDDMGQWNHPGEITEIGSNQITMQGVPYPVLGISDTGDVQMMYPEEEYEFDGESVTEYPMAKNGIRQEQKSLQNLDNLTNFTNYNKPQPGGWLNKYN